MAATTPKARKTKKATAPRKAARARVESGNGHGTPAPVADSPSEFRPLPQKQEVAHPYGNRPVYVFQPEGGGAPIVFPKIATVPVSAKFMWKIYDLAEIFQSFEWMKLAGVPRDIQERVVDLPIRERERFWTGWFNDVTAPLDMSQDSMGPPGES